MELVINKFGARIRKRSSRIQVVFPLSGEEKEYPIRKLSKIIIAKPSSISAGAVQLALENEVDIVYLGDFGMPYGRIYSSKPGRLTLIKRRQVENAESLAATYLSRQFILGKIKNQRGYLEFLQKGREDDFSAEVQKIKDTQRLLNLVSGPIKHTREQLFGLEGHAADIYFSALKKVVDFSGRDPRGKDVFNIFLNYGYGVLYNEVERNCLLVGLDPNIGFLHTDRYGKPALVLDLVEEYRTPIVDSVIVPLFLAKEASQKDLQQGKVLTKFGRSKVIKALFSRLYQKMKYQGRTMRVKTAMKNHTRVLAHYLVGKKREYDPFGFKNF